MREPGMCGRHAPAADPFQRCSAGAGL